MQTLTHVLILLTACTTFAAGQRPNIILVMTDDQGWGEVGFHGNKVLKTPNLDRFAAEGTELTNFYVSPMCTPTRSSLMTGRYHFRTGAHDTYIGRSNMNPQETTIAEVFAGAGYRTGIFGKWHLGENYPMRAIDQGFQSAVVHGGGGIGQFADYPKNSYWDPTLLYNDTFRKAKGYCTDVFIDESIRFIKDSRNQPFFCYIPLNIPHSPFDVGKEFREGYDKQNLKDPDGRNWVAPIYGMITQFDGAFQRLVDALDKLGLRDNTIIIFMTDNGPNSVYCTAGLRARKGSVYENGIRSPFVIQWPKAMKGGRKFKDPAMHIDLLPTLAEACGIKLPAKLNVDGKSILPLLTGKVKTLPQRYLFMQHNRGNLPTKYRNGMVRNGPWKAVGNRGNRDSFELYNIEQDPGEKQNVADQHPEKVKAFVREYEAWFDDVTEELRRKEGMPYPIELNPIQKHDFRFTWQDWWGDKTGWRPTNYGRWRMNNPGLIERFDVTILPHRQHHGQAATVKFIWQGKTVVKTYDKLPTNLSLGIVELAKGIGFMEAQLHIDGKMWGVQEVQIKAHGVATTSALPEEPATTQAEDETEREVNPAKPVKIPEVRGHFIRIELPGRNRVLSLAEVEVYAKGKNVALSKQATQSSVLGNGGSGAVAGRAVDGGRSGEYRDKSMTHTERETDPWWEVNLGKNVGIEKIILYNRDGKAAARLDGFTLKILDGKKQVVFSKELVPQSNKIVFMRKELGPIWFIGDSITQGNADGDEKSSPRKALYDVLKKNGYSFSFTGHHAPNVDGLADTESTPAANLYHYHSGVSGIKIAGMTNRLRAIWGQGRLATVKPDTICIMLGTNDIGRGEIDGTPARLKALLDQIYALKGIGKAKVFVASIPPNRRKEAQRTDVIIFNEAIQQLVTEYKTAGKNIYFVDQFKALDADYVANMRPDNLHPNSAGNAVMGKQWFDSIELELATEGTEQAEMLFPGARTDFKGYDKYQFRLKNKESGRDITVQVVAPEKPAPGKPWLWRNLFWTSIGRFNDTDLKLVEEGYHVVVVYGDVTGHPRGNPNVKTVYDHLTTEHKFSKTFSAAAMSRGGFMVFTYASAYPEQIESIFMDNACADALSWPAGKPYAGHLGYTAPGSKSSFEMYLGPYGFESFEEAVEYFKTRGSPIHMLKPLAKAGIPILSVCGKNDHAVPYEENDAVLEKRYKALGGDITVIVEDKGHKHGTTENVDAVLGFIRKHTRKP